jgi:hypothetical protein
MEEWRFNGGEWSPSPNSLRYITILSSQLGVGFLSRLFLSAFPTKIFYAFLISPMRAAFPAHIILFELSIEMLFITRHVIRNKFYETL